MRRLAGVCALASLIVLTGGAAASHDAGHPWSGRWRVAYAGGATGTITFGLVADDVGKAAFTPLRVRPCKGATDYYVGRISRTRAAYAGHVACTDRTGALLTAAYRNDEDDRLRVGRLTLRLAPDRRTFEGTFTLAGQTRRRMLSGAFGAHYAGDGAGSCPSLPPAPGSTAATGPVRVVSFEPSVEFRHRGGQRWCELFAGSGLEQGDDVRVDPDGEVMLRVAGFTLTVDGPAQLELTRVPTAAGQGRTLLKVLAGRVAAQRSSAAAGELRLATPTVTGIRGRDYSVFHDPGGAASVVSSQRGEAEVDPAAGGLENVTLEGGREVEVSRGGLSGIALRGRAGTPKGAVGRARALELAMAVVARHDERCDVEVTTFGLKKIVRGWRVSIRLDGLRIRGPAVWTAVGTRLVAENALAERVAAGCGPPEGEE